MTSKIRKIHLINEVEIKEMLEHPTFNLNHRPRWKKIIESRYGIRDNRPKSLKEVAKNFKVTPTRIRQIQFKVLDLIRENKLK